MTRLLHSTVLIIPTCACYTPNFLWQFMITLQQEIGIYYLEMKFYESSNTWHGHTQEKILTSKILSLFTAMENTQVPQSC